MLRSTLFIILFFIGFNQTLSYSAVEDERIIRSYLTQMRPKAPTDHAKIARNLVHKSKWASIGTLSTEEVLQGFPMVNIISIADGIKNGESTGVIYFFSTTLDFTGKDLLVHNKTTLMISDDEDLFCSKQNMDPMEPTCSRIHISGSVTKMDKSFPDYKIGFDSLVTLHPAAYNWIKAHNFSLCKVNIENIYVLDYYGGPHRVLPEKYYSTIPDSNQPQKGLLNMSKEKKDDLDNSLEFYSTNNQVNIKIHKNKYKKINIFV